MQRALEENLGRMGALIESAQQRSPKRKCIYSEKKSIFQKLYDLYVEEYEEEPQSAHELRRNLKLIEKLVMREDLARLVVNLHPVNEGYSLVLMGEIGYESETIELPYEERELLEYLDVAELPPILVERLETSQVNVFYSGCIFTEIRDYGEYRNMPTCTFQTRCVLLCPTKQTLACDVHDNPEKPLENHWVFESQQQLASLRLHPSEAVSCTNGLPSVKPRMKSYPMKRYFRKGYRPSLHQRQESGWTHCLSPPQVRSLTSSQTDMGNKAGQHYGQKIFKAEDDVEMWKQSPYHLATPSGKYGTSRPTANDSYQVNDRYSRHFEAPNQHQKLRLSVMESSKDPLLSKTLHPCEIPASHFDTDCLLDWYMNEEKFAAAAYQDLFRKEARCPDRMSHSASGLASPGQLSPRKEIETPQKVSVRVLQKHSPLFIKVPSTSGNHSVANSSTPEQASAILKPATPSPASKLPVPSPKPSVDFGQVSPHSAWAPSPASSSRMDTTTVGLTSTGGPSSANANCPVPAAQISARYPYSVHDYCRRPGGQTPAEINQNDCVPSKVPPPTAVPGAVKAAPRACVLQRTSIVKPLTVLSLPNGHFIMISQQQQQVSRIIIRNPSTASNQPGAQPSISQVQNSNQQSVTVTRVERLVPLRVVVMSSKIPEQSVPQKRPQPLSASPQQESPAKQIKLSDPGMLEMEEAKQVRK
ncbi:transcription factor SPT20 homolog [Echinops telfairi]|uniref:Transcription factor SPT20 homolog n=7 Tax=Echinops telfairi TaxID=9371 RepID=A0AC55D4J2_ECHTE|nr:transcription factor SPT20 homolog [Echinops telfairi]XP_045146665.1 transcription factor SPT20 homolog [Echinops telfairi]XP_045146666.1 transcription factor SPT20 homolog [Echinops telfairi]XP_045146667.1 transcription factor SPT20 homolog [Echinops telfairi]XP_045146668.1 transcription factor SPT20 homolog [Echinops telfairi]XP_045146669.1 transcription factor SPT20 homolog [Echinops telfairi]XP_045146670.1 transcription factor SPT20 homolog [Echinops telfairi]